MTLKDALIKALGELKIASSTKEVLDYILTYKCYDFKEAKTPQDTVSASLGRFIRHGDSRVSRIKEKGGVYLYYLSVNEETIKDSQEKEIETSLNAQKGKTKTNDKEEIYKESSLHKLLCTFLYSKGISSKTIAQQRSNGSDDIGKIWIHPDMIGVEFLDSNYKQDSRKLLRIINVKEKVKIYSYEIKREIKTDIQLKEYYFQAVSNSSWANYGYLVAFDISSTLKDELTRLNEAFGIGVIQLSANPFESKILHAASHKDLDFKTVDKLCINKDFTGFITKLTNYLDAQENYITLSKDNLIGYCDEKFSENNEEAIRAYCIEKSIPMELTEED